MLSSIKRALITLTILTIAAVLGLFFYTKVHTYSNDGSETGNSSGNLYNGGLFCVQKDTIYFSNTDDGGSLYRMNLDCNDIQKVSDETAIYLNTDDNYLYYAKANDITQYSTKFYTMLNNNGIYRINYSGTELKLISSDPGAFLFLQGNDLFYEQYNVNLGYSLIQCKTDGAEERNLAMKSTIPFYYEDTSLYFNDNSKSGNINYMNLDSYNEKTYLTGSIVYPIFMNDYIYYINREDKYIYRMKKDGSHPELLVKSPCLTYNITNTGNYLYYQTNGEETDLLGRINLETLEKETVKEGHFKQIQVTPYYVFFKSKYSKNTYMLLGDGSIHVKKFEPMA